jgi:hypothetical protein
MKDRKPVSPISPRNRHGDPVPMDPGKASTHRPNLGRDIQAKIGQQLRAMYDDVVNQGIPERFVELLKRLDEDHQGHKD